jgi:hypothetical protein
MVFIVDLRGLKQDQFLACVLFTRRRLALNPPSGNEFDSPLLCAPVAIVAEQSPIRPDLGDSPELFAARMTVETLCFSMPKFVGKTDVTPNVEKFRGRVRPRPL